MNLSEYEVIIIKNGESIINSKDEEFQNVVTKASGINDSSEDEGIDKFNNGWALGFGDNNGFMIYFHESMVAIIENQDLKNVTYITDFKFILGNRISVVTHYNTKINVKKIGYCQYILTMKYKGDKYKIIFARKVSKYLEIYNKNNYLGKRIYKKIYGLLGLNTEK